jgi:SAM-dependent methyltransferase
LDLFPQPENFKDFTNAEWIQADICDPTLSLPKYDRILSMCVFHHLSDPKVAMENVKKFLKPEGCFSLFLPSDPGILNRLNRKLFVLPKTRKLGFSKYELVNAREHRNHYWALKEELEYQFKDYKISRRYYPFGIPTGNLSLFSIWTIQSKRP